MKKLYSSLRNNKIYLFIILTSLFLLLTGFVQGKFFDDWKFIKSDGLGYYVYLPSIFHNHSLEHSETLSNYLRIEAEELPNEYVGIYKLENENYLSKYPFGTALLQAPFFIVADIIATLFIENRNGFEAIYQYANFFSAIFYFALSNFIIFKLLRKRFSEKITLTTLSIMFLGTNIINYLTYESSFSHVYSLFLISLLCYIVDSKNYHKDNKKIIITGIIIGLISIVRNTNATLIVVPIYFLAINILLNKENNSVLINKLKEFIKKLIVLGLSSSAIVIPLFLYWKAVTGEFFINSYDHESFDFLNPQFANVLFNVTSGAFFWHPILLLSFISLLIYSFRKKDNLSKIGILVLLINFYIISSWWAWWYGFSFGHRGFTDFYVFFYIGLAFLISQICEFIKNRRGLKRNISIAFILIVSLFLISLNLIQLNNYWRGSLAPYNITWERYKAFFFRPCVNVPVEIFRCDEID